MIGKRVLLMYISDVSGHRSAAMAIERALKTIAPDTEIMSINAFNYTNPITEKIINSIYMGVVSKAPKIWDYLYDNPAVAKRIAKIKDMVHKFNSPKLKRLFDEFRPDIVVCTQAFPCGMVADFKKHYNSSIPLVAVLTDYVPHSYWIYDTVNYYISPSKEVTERLIHKGVVAEKIKEFGIPFDAKFNDPVNKAHVLKKMGLQPGVFTMLIMGGSHGLGPLKTIVKSLERVNSPIQEIVVCGANRKLYSSMKKQAGKCKKTLKVFGFAENVHELMSVSDIILTKPGGITTAEALTKKIPMMIIKPLPGQEASNTAYLTRVGAAVNVDELEGISALVENLMSHESKLRALSAAAGSISKPHASVDIARLLLDATHD